MENTLPKNWTEVQLIEILQRFENGKRPKGGVQGILEGVPSIGGEHLNSDGRFKFEKVKYIPKKFADSITKGRINRHDILIVKDGATTGKTSFVDEKFPFDLAFVNEHVFICDTYSCVNSKSIFYYLFGKEGNNRILENFTGSAQGGINQKFAKNTLIPLPPRAEQDRIVAKLDGLFEQLESINKSLNHVPTLLKNFRQQILTQAVTGKLTEEWREARKNENATDTLKRIKDFRQKRYEEEAKRSKRKPRKPILEIDKSSDINYTLPSNWCQCFIGEIGEVCNGSTPSRKIQEYWNGNINWVSSGLVQNNSIWKTDEKITSEGFKNSSVKLLPKGSVLIAMIGEGKTRGQSAILEIEATTNQNIAGIIIDHGFVLSQYLQYWFIKNYEENRTQGSGTGPKALNGQKVRELDFVLPPTEEQQEIVKRVENLLTKADLIEAHYKALKTKIEHLPQAILHKAFKGNLVPQLDSDGDARELLKEIEGLKGDLKSKKS